MKKGRYLMLILFAFLIVSGCRDNDIDDQPVVLKASDTQNFVYDAMQIFYLYKGEKEVLADNYFETEDERNTYIGQFDSPEELFDDLLFRDDRFSIIVSDYHELENELDGITLNNGMDYGLARLQDSDHIIGYVRYVLPGTSAEENGVERGMLFDRIDGEQLTIDNYRDLMSPVSYTIGLVEADVENRQLSEVDKEIPLTKKEYTENPIYLDTVLKIGGQKIGYLVYNAFTNTFDEELNEVFGKFKEEGISDLIVDLRYNGGGSIETCKNLAGMITGQFDGQLFAKEAYNKNFRDDEINFSNNLNKNVKLNNLNLNKVYIIGTGSTASASELLINGLRPYIDVVQVGETTVGKFQGSTILYDSSDFSRSAVKPGHDYALLPLILKLTNADGVSDYVNGLDPDIAIDEDLLQMGTLGETNEPLLQAILEDITGTSPVAQRLATRSIKPYKLISERKANQLNYRQMISHNDILNK